MQEAHSTPCKLKLHDILPVAPSQTPQLTQARLLEARPSHALLGSPTSPSPIQAAAAAAAAAAANVLAVRDRGQNALSRKGGDAMIVAGGGSAAGVSGKCKPWQQQSQRHCTTLMSPYQVIEMQQQQQQTAKLSLLNDLKHQLALRNFTRGGGSRPPPLDLAPEQKLPLVQVSALFVPLHVCC
jgi:hypothetical protein